jgi:hypothetical protein
VKPGLIVPKGENILYQGLAIALAHAPAEYWMAKLDQASGYSEQAVAAHTMAGLLAINNDPEYALRHLAASYLSGAFPENDPFLRKYVTEGSMQIELAPGISVALPIGRQRGRPDPRPAARGPR